MARFSLGLLAILTTIGVLRAQSAVHEQWKAFLAGPSSGTYEPLSTTIRTCVISKCSDAEVAGRDGNFANFYKLLEFVEHGNHFAMEITFQIRPLYENAATPSEAINRNLGLASTLEPQFFLELIRKYNIPAGVFENLVCQSSLESIDRDDVRREEWRRRIQSLSKVTDRALAPLRDRAVALIQHDIDLYVPDGASGK